MKSDGFAMPLYNVSEIKRSDLDACPPVKAFEKIRFYQSKKNL